MLEWLANYAKSLVSSPDEVAVTTEDGTIVTVVNLQVSAADRKLFVGRNNRLFRAMSTVIALTGVRERKRYVLKVVD